MNVMRIVSVAIGVVVGFAAGYAAMALWDRFAKRRRLRRDWRVTKRRAP